LGLPEAFNRGKLIPDERAQAVVHTDRKGIIMPLYSYSRIGCFENCPRQYKFRYIEKPDIEIVQGVEAFLGSTVHTALEQCYRLARDGRAMSKDELLAFFRRTWDETRPENLRIVREGLSADDYIRVGLEVLSRYHDRHAPFDHEITVALERLVSFSLDPPGQYKMQGFIDRLSRDAAGRLQIHDYKTSATLPTQPEIDADKQLALYQIAVDAMWPDNNGIELIWHYLRFDTDLVSHRDKRQLDELRQVYIDKIKRIQAAEGLGNFPTNESPLCDWCEYVSLCPAKGGPAVPVTEQPMVIPVPTEAERRALVDEFIANDREVKRWETRQQQIREALVPLCEVGSSTLLAGSGKEGIMISRSRVVKLPTVSADSAAVERIRRLVEEAGLSAEYSSLDINGIQKALAEGRLPERLVERLQEFQQTTISDRVRIAKLK
jgi:putative RecB family exonuclease